MTTPAFLTTPEVAELLRVSVATIARLTRRVELPHFHCHQQPEEGDEEMTTQAQHIRPGDVVRVVFPSDKESA